MVLWIMVTFPQLRNHAFTCYWDVEAEVKLAWSGRSQSYCSCWFKSKLSVSLSYNFYNIFTQKYQNSINEHKTRLFKIERSSFIGIIDKKSSFGRLGDGHSCHLKYWETRKNLHIGSDSSKEKLSKSLLIIWKGPQNGNFFDWAGSGSLWRRWIMRIFVGQLIKQNLREGNTANIKIANKNTAVVYM